jgi:chromate transporter
MRESPYLTLLIVFIPFSLTAVGGGTSIFAGIQFQAVEVQHWVSAREFIDLFAIARSSPGPGSMLVTLLGWKVAGWSGALVATAALFVPSSLLCFMMARVWSKYRGKPWHKAAEQGLAPIGIGLLLAGTVAIFRMAGAGMLSWIIAIVAAALLALRPKINPLFVLLGGGLAFIVLAEWG